MPTCKSCNKELNSDGDLCLSCWLESETAKKKDDPGYCGLDPFTTGPNDPYFVSGACPEHDIEYDLLKEGKSEHDSLYVNGKFIVDSVKTAGLAVVNAAYAVATLPLYIIIGGIGGFFRWREVMPKVKGDKFEKDDMY